jgi:hypothetical protein
VAGESYGYRLARIRLAPDVNFPSLLQNHVVADERGQNGIGPATQTARE